MNKEEAIDAAARAEFEYQQAHRLSPIKGAWDELTPVQRSNFRAPARRIIHAYVEARASERTV